MPHPHTQPHHPLLLLSLLLLPLLVPAQQQQQQLLPYSDALARKASLYSSIAYGPPAAVASNQVCPPTHPPTYPPVHPSIHPPTHPSIESSTSHSNQPALPPNPPTHLPTHPPLQIYNESCRLEEFTILHTYLSLPKDRDAFAYVGIDVQEKLIVVAFKGSNDTEDYVTDISVRSPTHPPTHSMGRGRAGGSNALLHICHG